MQTRSVILIRYAVLWALLALIGSVSLAVVGHSQLPFSDELTKWPWLDMWARWDSRWYEMIARDGYWFDRSQQSPVAFFPLYPLTMRVIATVTGASFLKTGIFISVCAGLAAFFLFWKWSVQFGTAKTPRAQAG